MSKPSAWRQVKALVLNLPDDEVPSLSDRLKGRAPATVARPKAQRKDRGRGGSPASPAGHGSSPWAEAAAATAITSQTDETALWTPKTRKPSSIQRLARFALGALLLLFLWIGVRTAIWGANPQTEETPLPVSATYPTEAAAGTAEKFVAAFLTWDQDNQDARGAAMAPWYSGGEVPGDLGWNGQGKQTATAPAAVRVEYLDAEHARIIVTAMVQEAGKNKVPHPVSVEVKVQANKDGAAVYGTPGIVGTPVPIPAKAEGPEPITDSALSSETKDMAAHFFTEYGAKTDVSALTAPGSAVRGLGGSLTAPQVRTWTVREGAADQRTAEAVVDWTTPSGARLQSTYEVELVRVSGGTAARWQISTVKGTN